MHDPLQVINKLFFSKGYVWGLYHQHNEHEYLYRIDNCSIKVEGRTRKQVVPLCNFMDTQSQFFGFS